MKTLCIVSVKNMLKICMAEQANVIKLLEV